MVCFNAGGREACGTERGEEGGVARKIIQEEQNAAPRRGAICNTGRDADILGCKNTSVPTSKTASTSKTAHQSLLPPSCMQLTTQLSCNSYVIAIMATALLACCACHPAAVPATGGLPYSPGCTNMSWGMWGRKKDS